MISANSKTMNAPIALLMLLFVSSWLSIAGCPQVEGVTFFSLVTQGEGEGEVEVSPAGESFADGTPVTLTANPANGWDFVRWEGDVPSTNTDDNPLTVVMNSRKEITAVFEQGIVPGRAIGPVFLGDTFRDVTQALGLPSEVFPSSIFWSVYFFYDDLGISGSLVDIDQDEQPDAFEPVDFILASSPFAGTYRGVGIGSTREDVLDVMGAPEEIDGSDYWYWGAGICWGMEFGLVTSVTVFEPIRGERGGATPMDAQPIDREELRERHRNLRQRR